jgi:hypothetical protein
MMNMDDEIMDGGRKPSKIPHYPTLMAHLKVESSGTGDMYSKNTRVQPLVSGFPIRESSRDLLRPGFNALYLIALEVSEEQKGLISV